MENLNFFFIDLNYVRYLKDTETNARGFSRVPNMEYGDARKQKFLCGIVLQVNDMDYYVPVSSFKWQKPDNFLIIAQNGLVTSSLRFNYMFPVPKNLLTIRPINTEPNRAYRALLQQELRFCIDNQERIRNLAKRTYKRVISGFDRVLVKNSCDFKLLETACREYVAMLEKAKEAERLAREQQQRSQQQREHQLHRGRNGIRLTETEREQLRTEYNRNATVQQSTPDPVIEHAEQPAQNHVVRTIQPAREDTELEKQEPMQENFSEWQQNVQPSDNLPDDPDEPSLVDYDDWER